MSLTYDELTTAVEMELNGFTQQVEQAANLTSGITDTDLTLSVYDATQFSRGVVQVDDELMFVQSIDTQAKTLTVAPFGRGYLGTTAASHSTDAKVTNSPPFPRAAIKRAINEVIRSVYPTLWGYASTTFTVLSGVQGYSLPADCKDIMQLTWADPVSEEDVPVRRWRHDKWSGKVSVYDAIAPGRVVTVYYRKEPTALTNGSDVYPTVTGLPESTEDIVRLGAVVRLLPYLESTNASTMTAEADFSANSRVTSTSANALSRSLMQMYQLRLAEEGMKLVQSLPVRVHYTI